MPKTVPARLDEFGAALHQLLLQLPDHDAVTDTLDYLLGALFALTRAHELGFRDRTGAHFSVYRPHLANYALKIPKNQSVNNLWTAGFYFNSAIQRIASAFDRIPRMLGAKKKKKVGAKRVFTSAKERMTKVNHTPSDKWEKVYDEVNAFKHDPEGRAAGRTVAMTDAIESFEQMLNLLNGSTAKLAARY
jgi:hypothetical protein